MINHTQISQVFRICTIILAVKITHLVIFLIIFVNSLCEKVTLVIKITKPTQTKRHRLFAHRL